MNSYCISDIKNSYTKKCTNLFSTIAIFLPNFLIEYIFFSNTFGYYHLYDYNHCICTVYVCNLVLTLQTFKPQPAFDEMYFENFGATIAPILD